FFSPSISIACITFCRKSELYGFGIVIAQTIRFLSILCPNLAGYSYTNCPDRIFNILSEDTETAPKCDRYPKSNDRSFHNSMD
ncbi:MAG: hypothetical protein NT070_13300, partial [Cyanobacteria bacterium]|nr:hypothetical protein [Cyanobacteriota bacterium]